MSRVRRCSWEIGTRCHERATKRLKVTYLGEPTDKDPVFCDTHNEQVNTLIRPGWAVAGVETIEVQEVPA